MSHAPSAASSRTPAAPPHCNRLEEILAVYAPSAPKLAAWLEENLPQGFTVISLPPAHQARLRTSNALERINQEIQRRTRVARVFPNETSLLRLVTAL
jgi:putative transposase